MTVRLGRAIAGLLLTLAAPLATADICTFIGSDGDSWNSPGHWSNCSAGNGSTTGTPGPADTAIIDSLTVNIDGPRISVDVLELRNGTLEGAADIVAFRLLSTGGAIRGDTDLSRTRSLEIEEGSISGVLNLRDRQLVVTFGELELQGGGEMRVLGSTARPPCPDFQPPPKSTTAPALSAAPKITAGTPEVSLCVQSGGVLRVNQGSGESVVDGDLYNEGQIIISAGNTLRMEGGRIKMSDSGSTILDGGLLNNSGGASWEVLAGNINGAGTLQGDLDMFGGIIDPYSAGNSAGTINIIGNASFGRTTIVAFDLFDSGGGARAISQDGLNISGSASLQGVLWLYSNDPAPNSDFPLISATSLAFNPGSLINPYSLSHRSFSTSTSFILQRILGSDTCTWIGSAPGDFTDPSNWSNCNGTAPTSDDAVFIDSPTALVTINGPISIARLQLADPAASIMVNSPLQVTEYFAWHAGTLEGTAGITLGGSSNSLIGFDSVGMLLKQTGGSKHAPSKGPSARTLRTSLTNDGQLVLYGPFGMQGDSSANLLNAGTIDMFGYGETELSNTLTLNQLVNSGDIFVLQSTEAAVIGSYEQTGGSLNLDPGSKLRLPLTGTFFGNIGSSAPVELTLTGGPWSQDSGSEIDLQGILRINSSGAVFGSFGVSDLRIETPAADLTIQSPVQLLPVVSVVAGTFATSVAQNIGILTTDNATISGSSGGSFSILQDWYVIGDTSLQDVNVDMPGSASLRLHADNALNITNGIVSIAGGLTAENQTFPESAILAINSGGAVNLAGQLSLDFARLLINGNFSLQNFAVVFLQNDAELTLDGGSGTLTLPSNAVLRGNGVINGNLANSAGVINPGNFAPGRLQINGTLSQSASGRVDLEIAGPGVIRGVPQFDEIEVSGSASLGGTVQIIQASGYDPGPSDAHDLINYSSHSGSFDTANLDPNFADTHEVVYAPSAFRMQPLPAGPVDCTWTAAAGDWDVPSNWSCNAVPGASDTARILSPTADVDATPQSPDPDRLIGTLVMADGRVFGSGNIIVGTSLQWTQGTIAGSGVDPINDRLFIGPAATASFPLNGNAIRLMDSRTLVNQGTLNWDGGVLELKDGPLFINAGGATINFNTTFAGDTIQDSGSGSSEFSNMGTVIKAGPSSLVLLLPFTGNGLLTINDGTFHVTQPPDSSFVGATINVPGAFEIEHSAFTYSSGVNFSGNGSIRVRSGALPTFEGSFSSTLGVDVLDNGVATFNTGTIIGLNALHVFDTAVVQGTSSFDVVDLQWNGGEIRGTVGTHLNVGPGSTSLIASTAAKVLRTRELRIDELEWREGNIDVRDNARITVNGQFNLGFNAFIGNRSMSCSAACASTVIDNNGIIAAQVNASSLYTFDNTVSFRNEASGVIAITAGRLNIDNLTSNQGIVDLGFQDNTAMLGQTGLGSFTFSGTAQLRGRGTVVGDVDISSGGIIAPQKFDGDLIGTLNISGNLNQGSGKLQVKLNGTGAGQFDQVVVTGSVTPGAVEPLGSGLAGGQSVPFINHATRAGNYTSLVGANAADYTFDNAAGTSTRLQAVGGAPMDCTWTAVTPANWDASASNWSCNAIPGSGDTVRVLSSSADININGSRTVASLYMADGRLAGNGVIQVDSLLDWSGGVLEGNSPGSDTFNLGPAATATFTAGASPKILRRRNFANAGTIAWTSGDLQIATDNTEFRNNGTLNINNTAGTPIVVIGDGAAGISFHNAFVATAINKAGNGIFRIAANVVFPNGAPVQVSAGKFLVQSEGGDNGQYSVSAGAFLEFDIAGVGIRNLVAGSSISGSGLVVKKGSGTLQFDATGIQAASLGTRLENGLLQYSGDQNFDNLTIVGGELAGAGENWNVASSFVFSSGLVSGSPLTNINVLSSATALFDGGAKAFNRRTLTISGSANWTSGNIALQNGPGFAILGSGSLVANLASPTTMVRSGVGTPTMTNLGSFSKSGSGALTLDAAPLGGAGSVTVSGGTLSLAQHVSGSFVGATVNNPGSLRLGGMTPFTYLPGVSFSGNGKIEVSTIVPVTIQGGLASGLQLAVLTGELIVDSAPLVTVQSIAVFDTAALRGSSSFNTTDFNWSGGEISGPFGTSLSISGLVGVLQGPPGILHTLNGRTLDVTGGLLWVAGDLDAINGAALNVSGTGLLDMNAFDGAVRTLRCTAACSNPVLNNDGIVRSDGNPAGRHTIAASAPVNNNPTGLFDVRNGRIDVDGTFNILGDINLGAFTESGTLGRSSPGTFTLTNTTFLQGSGTIDASVVMQNGARMEPKQNLASSVGTITITGGLNHSAGGVLAVEANGVGAGLFDQILVGGTVNPGPVEPAPLVLTTGQSVPFITHTTRTASYTSLVGANAGAYDFDNSSGTETRLQPSGPLTCTWDSLPAPPNTWENAAHWSCGAVPGPGDIAILDDNLDLVTLTQAVTVGTLDLRAGRINGDFNFSIQDSFLWTGGEFAATTVSVYTELLAGGSATLSGAQKTAITRDIRLFADTSWTTGLIELRDGARFTIEPGVTLTSNPGGSAEAFVGTGTGNGEIFNLGSIVKVGPNESGADFRTNYSGSGLLDVQAGTFKMRGPGTYPGAFNAAAGAFLQFDTSNRSFTGTSSISGAGTLRFGDLGPGLSVNTVAGSFSASGAVEIRHAELQLTVPGISLSQLALLRPNSSLLTGFDFAVSSLLTWDDGKIAGSTTGLTLSLLNSAIANLNGISGTSRELRMLQLFNQGTLNFGQGSLRIGDSAELRNAGLLVANAATQLLISGTGSIPRSFNNISGGVLRKNGIADLSIGSTSVGEDLPFSNSGGVEITGGSLSLFQNGTDSGTYTLGATAVLRTSGLGIRALNGDILGSGILQVADVSQTAVRGNLSITRLRVDNTARADLDTPGFAVTIPVLDLQGGEIFGADEMEVGQLEWTAGTISGSNSDILLVNGIGSVIVDDPLPRSLDGRQLQIQSTLRWASGNIDIRNSSLIHILSSGRLEMNSASSSTWQLDCGGSCGAPQILNDGQLVKTGDASTFNLGSALGLTNQALLQVDNGTLGLPGSFATASSSVIDVFGSGTLSQGVGQPLTISDGLLVGNGSLVADLTLGASARIEPGPGGGTPGIGTFTIGGDLMQQGTLQIDILGNSPGQFDLLQVLGLVAPGDVEPAGPGLSPGQRVSFVQHSGRSANYSSVTGAQAANYTFDNASQANTDLVFVGTKTLVVDRSDDPLPSTAANEACTTAANDCSLRGALIRTNGSPGDDRIEFAIPGVPGQVHTLLLAAALPQVTESVEIDGTTQNGYVPNSNVSGPINGSPKIELDGSFLSAQPGPDSEALNFSNSVITTAVRGLAFVDFEQTLQVNAGNFRLMNSFVGIHADGVTDSNCLAGVILGNGSAQIGGESAAERNLLSGCQTNVAVLGDGSSSMIQNNLIGPIATNASTLPGQQVGIKVSAVCAASPPSIQIGTPGFGNVIGGHTAAAIQVMEPFGTTGSLSCAIPASLTVQGNAIGISGAGGLSMPNAIGIHWLRQSGALANALVAVGGANAAANLIANQTGSGIVAVPDVTGLAILENSFSGNLGLGIDLRPDFSGAEVDKRTSNDTGDSDSGANRLQNFPVITNISGTNVSYYVDSDPAHSDYSNGLAIKFYESVDGQGLQWLGSDIYSAADFGTGAPPGIRIATLGRALPPSGLIVAIATDTVGNSSEFSFVSTSLSFTAVSPEPADVGTPRSISGRIVSSNGEPFRPTGTLVVGDGTDTCAAPVLSPGTAGETLFSCSLPTSGGAGARTITATYTADDRLFTNASATIASTVNNATAITTTAVVTVNPSPSLPGQPVTLTASVTASAGPAPTGSVTVQATAPFTESCVAPLASGGGSSSTGSCQVTPTSPGLRSFTSSYPGAAGFLPSTSVSGLPLIVQGTASFPANGVVQTPDETQIGQPFTVLVPVLGNGLTPTGTVVVTPLPLGTAQSCVLAATATPNLAECSVQIVAPVAVGKVLRVRYQGSADLVFPAAETFVTHNTTRASTSVRVISDTPDPSNSKAPVTVQFEVSAANGISTLAPLSGSVTVSDGLDSCTGSLTSATSGTLTTGSCTLTLRVGGTRQLVATYQGNENFNVGVSPPEPHVVTGGVGNDLSITVRNSQRVVTGGVEVEYLIEVVNAGSSGAGSTLVQNPLPSQMPNATWSCIPTLPSQCPANGAGAINNLVDLIGGGRVSFRLRGLVNAQDGEIVNTATVTPATGITDPDLSNNSATDRDPIGLFGDGLEEPGSE